MHASQLASNQPKDQQPNRQKRRAGSGHDVLAPKPEETHLNPPSTPRSGTRAGTGRKETGRRENRGVWLLIEQGREGMEWKTEEGVVQGGFLFSPPPGAPLLSFRYSPPPLPLGARL